LIDNSILISIHPQFVDAIVKQEKNHEFRNYDLPTNELWVYTTSPQATIQYKIITSQPIVQPEKINNTGWGNIEFNSGKKQAKFAHPIREVYELKKPISLNQLKNTLNVFPPQKYTYIRNNKLLQSALEKITLQRVW
jgi:predicted transcriptional regulator